MHIDQLTPFVKGCNIHSENSLKKNTFEKGLMSVVQAQSSYSKNYPLEYKYDKPLKQCALDALEKGLEGSYPKINSSIIKCKNLALINSLINVTSLNEQHAKKMEIFLGGQKNDGVELPVLSKHDDNVFTSMAISTGKFSEYQLLGRIRQLITSAQQLLPFLYLNDLDALSQLDSISAEDMSTLEKFLQSIFIISAMQTPYELVRQKECNAILNTLLESMPLALIEESCRLYSALKAAGMYAGWMVGQSSTTGGLLLLCGIIYRYGIKDNRSDANAGCNILNKMFTALKYFNNFFITFPYNLEQSLSNSGSINKNNDIKQTKVLNLQNCSLSAKDSLLEYSSCLASPSPAKDASNTMGQSKFEPVATSAVQYNLINKKDAFLVSGMALSWLALGVPSLAAAGGLIFYLCMGRSQNKSSPVVINNRDVKETRNAIKFFDVGNEQPELNANDASLMDSLFIVLESNIHSYDDFLDTEMLENALLRELTVIKKDIFYHENKIIIDSSKNRMRRSTPENETNRIMGMSASEVQLHMLVQEVIDEFRKSDSGKGFLARTFNIYTYPHNLGSEKLKKAGATENGCLAHANNIDNQKNINRKAVGLINDYGYDFPEKSYLLIKVFDKEGNLNDIWQVFIPQKFINGEPAPGTTEYYKRSKWQKIISNIITEKSRVVALDKFPSNVIRQNKNILSVRDVCRITSSNLFPPASESTFKNYIYASRDSDIGDIAWEIRKIPLWLNEKNEELSDDNIFDKLSAVYTAPEGMDVKLVMLSEKGELITQFIELESHERDRYIIKAKIWEILRGVKGYTARNCTEDSFYNEPIRAFSIEYIHKHETIFLIESKVNRMRQIPQGDTALAKDFGGHKNMEFISCLIKGEKQNISHMLSDRLFRQISDEAKLFEAKCKVSFLRGLLHAGEGVTPSGEGDNIPESTYQPGDERAYVNIVFGESYFKKFLVAKEVEINLEIEKIHAKFKDLPKEISNMTWYYKNKYTNNIILPATHDNSHEKSLQSMINTLKFLRMKSYKNIDYDVKRNIIMHVNSALAFYKNEKNLANDISLTEKIFPVWSSTVENYNQDMLDFCKVNYNNLSYTAKGVYESLLRIRKKSRNYLPSNNLVLSIYAWAKGLNGIISFGPSTPGITHYSALELATGQHRKSGHVFFLPLLNEDIFNYLDNFPLQEMVSRNYRELLKDPEKILNDVEHYRDILMEGVFNPDSYKDFTTDQHESILSFLKTPGNSSFVENRNRFVKELLYIPRKNSTLRDTAGEGYLLQMSPYLMISKPIKNKFFDNYSTVSKSMNNEVVLDSQASLLLSRKNYGNDHLSGNSTQIRKKITRFYNNPTMSNVYYSSGYSLSISRNSAKDLNAILKDLAKINFFEKLRIVDNFIITNEELNKLQKHVWFDKFVSLISLSSIFWAPAWSPTISSNIKIALFLNFDMFLSIGPGIGRILDLAKTQQQVKDEIDKIVISSILTALGNSIGYALDARKLSRLSTRLKEFDLADEKINMILETLFEIKPYDIHMVNIRNKMETEVKTLNLLDNPSFSELFENIDVLTDKQRLDNIIREIQKLHTSSASITEWIKPLEDFRTEVNSIRSALSLIDESELISLVEGFEDMIGPLIIYLDEATTIMRSADNLLDELRGVVNHRFQHASDTFLKHMLGIGEDSEPDDLRESIRVLMDYNNGETWERLTEEQQKSLLFKIIFWNQGKKILNTKFGKCFKFLRRNVFTIESAVSPIRALYEFFKVDSIEQIKDRKTTTLTPKPINHYS